jgi:hypothetical protein
MSISGLMGFFSPFQDLALRNPTVRSICEHPQGKCGHSIRGAAGQFWAEARGCRCAEPGMGTGNQDVMLERLVLAIERIARALEQQSASKICALAPEALSKEDAARFIGADVASIEHLIRTRKLAYVQHGSQRGRVIAVESLREFLQEYRQATGEELIRKSRGR